MADPAASVLARLKNKAQQTGVSYQLYLQLFCQEELLRRLEKSPYASNLILKGGLFLYTVSNFESRFTIDIDFLIKEISSSPKQLATLLMNVMATPTGNDYITFELVKFTPITVTQKYPGQSASLIAHIKNVRVPLSIDFGVDDVVVPHPQKRTLPTQLEGFESPSIHTYSLETSIAEKLDAILSRMEYTSRMKDFYDLYFLAHRFNFDGSILANALHSTFVHRNRSYIKTQIDDLEAFSQNKGMQSKWNAFCRKTNISDVSFEDVIATITNFLKEPYLAALSNELYPAHWSAQDGIWLPTDNTPNVKTLRAMLEAEAKDAGLIEDDSPSFSNTKDLLHYLEH
jgi:predicted nucleotidyltransferase component of viral defense system